MEIGISAPQWGPAACPAAIHAVANAADRVAYPSVWATDHYPWQTVITEGPDEPPLLDPVAVLATVAAHCPRVRLGVSTLVVPWYRPSLLVRAIATLEVLAEGRVTVAIEGGGAQEFLLHRASAPGDAVGRLCGSNEPLRHRTPILVAGTSRSVLDLVARHADGWNPLNLAAPDVARGWRAVREGADLAGRDPEALRLVARADVVVTARPLGADRLPYTGAIGQIAQDLDELRQAGVHEVVLGVGDGVSPAPTLDELLDVYARVAEALV